MAVSPSKTKQPLSSRDPNTCSPTKSSSTLSKPTHEKPKSETMQQNGISIFRDVTDTTEEPTTHEELTKRVAEAHAKGQTYVSPSDEILSPTTKKLSEIRGKRFANAKKPQSLFAKTLAREGMKSQEKLNAMTKPAE